MAALPYIQLYVADYLADTAHLTASEHGAYLLLIMNYWQRGKPLNNANERLANVARMSSDEWATSKPTLEEFFDIDGDVWTHHRIEEDLETVRLKSEAAKAAAEKSAKIRQRKAAKKQQDERTLSERSTDAERNLSHIDTEYTKEDNNPPVAPPSENPEPQEAAEPPTTGSEEPPKEKPKTKATRLSPDWELPDDWREWAEGERPELKISIVGEMFRDHWISQGGQKGAKKDWFATWRNWVRNQQAKPHICKFPQSQRPTLRAVGDDPRFYAGGI